MNLKDFKQAGHWPTLLAAFLYFDISFMVWVSLGPLIIYVTQGMTVSVEEKFTLVALPVLAGAVLRIPLGILADRIGSKQTGIMAQLVAIAAVAWAAVAGFSGIDALRLFAILLGVAGASFAVALPQASRWYPPQYQGVVLGIAGAGNMGVVLDTLFGPTLAESHGWQAVYGLLLIPMVLVLAFYAVAAKRPPSAPRPAAWSQYRSVLQDGDGRWFMFFYFITFGGFVGLANALPLYFTVQYHASGVAAGLVVAFIVACGSAFRPVGGYIADRIGGITTLLVLFAAVAGAYAVVAGLPAGPAPVSGTAYSLGQLPGIAWSAVILFSLGVLALGMGNGAVFQLIPQRFRNEIGIMTGLVGCAGGIGGFFLPKALGLAKAATGGFGAGFACFALLALLGLLGLLLVKTRWRTTWGAASGARV
jgi:NNP family nitrate/nitrite transporter-like MFS transporter